MAFLSQIYSALFRRTSTFALTIITGAFLFERIIDDGGDFVYNRINQGYYGSITKIYKTWVVVQRRKDGSVNFFRDWEDYKKGFGNLDGEFWIGNDNLHYLTNQADTRLHIELRSWDSPQTSHHAYYSHIRVASESDLYRLYVGGFRDDLSDAGDSLTSIWETHTEQPFSTHDRDHDNRYYDNCADLYHGAWWFGNCFDSHLNGRYYRTPHHDDYFRRDGIQWNSLHLHTSLMRSEMMVAPAEIDVMSNEV